MQESRNRNLGAVERDFARIGNRTDEIDHHGHIAALLGGRVVSLEGTAEQGSVPKTLAEVIGNHATIFWTTAYHNITKAGINPIVMI